MEVNINLLKKIDLYLCKAGNVEENCTSESWFDRAIINPSAIHDNTVFTEKFYCTTLTNQDCNFELESSTNYETCVCNERLEKTKPAALTSAVAIVSTKDTDNNKEPIASVFNTLKYLMLKVSIIQYFNLPLARRQHFHP